MKEGIVIADSGGLGYSFVKDIVNYLRNEKKVHVEMSDIYEKDFKDREFKVRILKNIRRKRVFFIHDSNKEPCRWFTEMGFVLDAMKFSSPDEIVAVLPYVRFARQDRKDESRVSVNAKVVANFVSLYANRGMTVDLHSPQMQQYFTIPMDNLYSFPSLIEHLSKKGVLENIVVVSPDAGGAKRVESLVKRMEKRGIIADLAIGYKTRKKENCVEKIKIMGEVKGKNCLIVDDMIDTGGTIETAAGVLKCMGAEKVYAYGTHGLFTDGVDKFKQIDKIYTSDTLLAPKNDKIEVISLASLFGEAIYRTLRGESLSELFD